MKRFIAFLVVAVVCVPFAVMAADEPGDVLEYDDNTYSIYVEVKKLFSPSVKEDSLEISRPAVDGVTFSVSTSNEWTEARLSAAKEFKVHETDTTEIGISVGLAVRQTLPKADVIADETQYGPVVQYHQTYGGGTGHFIARVEAYYGSEGKSGFRHLEGHLINTHWWGGEEDNVRIGHVLRGSYISDPLGYGEFVGGDWSSKTKTLDAELDVIFKFKGRSIEPFVSGQWTKVRNDGSAQTAVGVFPFSEEQRITRYGIGARQYKWFGQSATALWWRAFLAYEKIDDTGGPYADHTGGFVSLSAGYTF